MFTGIVEELGTVIGNDVAASVGQAANGWGNTGARLTLAASIVLGGSDLGASIAVNGCCLTLVDQGVDASGRGWWSTDVSDETLSRTNLGALSPGDVVNLERPMELGERLGGHIVLGHVDCLGEIVAPVPDLVVRVPAERMRLIVEKGSITVDGISLTAFGLGADTFRVAVIPHTSAVTTLGHKGAGAVVNIEFDVLAKHIERLIQPHRDALHGG